MVLFIELNFSFAGAFEGLIGCGYSLRLSHSKNEVGLGRGRGKTIYIGKRLYLGIGLGFTSLEKSLHLLGLHYFSYKMGDFN